MFQTNAEFLAVMGQFAVTGFFLGIFYDIIRSFRTIFSTGKVFAFITDFLAMIISGLVLIFFGVDTPTGKLRLLYILSAVFGMTFYLITIGKITVYPARLAGRFVKFIKSLFRKYIAVPIYNLLCSIKQKLTAIFVELQQKNRKYQENLRFGLKKTPLLLYNKNNNKMSKVCQNGGEERNVIKAKIRKKA